MALFTFDQLLTPTTVEEVKGTIYAYMAALGLPTTAWQALSPTRVLVDVLARLIAVVINNCVLIARSMFKDYSEGKWLTTLSKQMYNVDRIESTFAVGEFVANNAGGGVYDWDPEEIVFRKVGTSLTYVNTDAVHIGSFETGVSILVRATEEGSASNASTGQLELVTSMTGVTGSNLQAVVGQDEESDADLRVRDDNKIEALSPNGPPGIYEFVAKTPALNGGVSINRARVLPPPGDGTVTIVVASSLGPIAPGDVALVQVGIDTWATPTTVTATVASATALGLGYTTTVYVRSVGAPDSTVLTAAVKSAMIAYINALPLGGVEFTPGAGVLPWRGMLGAVENTLVGTTKPVLKAELSIETDILMLQTDVAILLAGSITVTVVQI